ncbi:MAG: DUF1553 domain-containing protein [Runella sp.]
MRWGLLAFITVVVLWASWYGLREKPISYNEQIRPILNKKCLGCHGGVKKSGGFSLLFEEEALGKTKSGKPAIIPGDAQSSEFIKRLRHPDPEMRMPQDSDPLSDEEVELLTRWVNQGAKWEVHWAYIPPNPNIKPPKLTNWGHNGIDAFVAERLSNENLKPSPEANRATLLRRVSLDLTGLPPTHQQMAEFLADTSPNAYEKQVDKLLSSPHFGERWAAMWLDLARYADSKGYEKDLKRSIWKYRDWVIEAFNQDMPFDQFTVEQLAGDMLPHATENQLIATAFHRNTMANDEGGTNDEEFRIAAQVERVGTTWEVWQGTTMACVQCHSHPYDPFRHEDFYRFMAYFNNTQDRDIYNEKPKLYTYSIENAQKINKLAQWISQQKLPYKIPTWTNTSTDAGLDERKRAFLHQWGVQKIEAEDFDSSSRHIELWDDQTTVMQTTEGAYIVFNEVDLSDVAQVTYRYTTSFSSFIELRLDHLNGPLISRAKVQATQEGDPGQWSRWNTFGTSTHPIKPTKGKHTLYVVFRKDKEFRSDLLHLDWLDFYRPSAPRWQLSKAVQDSLAVLAAIPAVTTPIMQELPPLHRRKTHVFIRGNWLTPGTEVKPGLPSIFQTKNTPKTRLELARWLVSPQNPLTARVIVNRFWEQLFGNGLVETLEDFGTQGFKPTHAELLDWLAVRFSQKQRWSVKALLRLMVTSATYRQSAEAPASLIAQDPRNTLLARGPRVRLSAEQIRDQSLAVCGLLNTTLYGPSVLPPNPIDGSWRNAPVADRYRRAIYTFWRRTDPYPSMMTFDSPQRNICVSRRIRTNTPLQALTTLNDTVYVEAAQKLALYMQKTAKDPVNQLKAGYEKVMLRPASENKLKLLKQFYDEALVQYNKQPQKAERLFNHTLAQRQPETAALTLVANVMLNLDEFLTK